MRLVLAVNAFALTLLVYPSQACALTYEKWKNIEDDLTAKIYLRGASEGISWANAAIQDGHPKIYCAPENLAITVEQYADILERRALKTPDFHKHHIEMLLLLGLEETFPC